MSLIASYVYGPYITTYKPSSIVVPMKVLLWLLQPFSLHAIILIE